MITTVCMKIKPFHQDKLEELPFTFKRSASIILYTICSVQQLFMHSTVAFNRGILLNQDRNNNETAVANPVLNLLLLSEGTTLYIVFYSCLSETRHKLPGTPSRPGEPLSPGCPDIFEIPGGPGGPSCPGMPKGPWTPERKKRNNQYYKENALLQL